MKKQLLTSTALVAAGVLAASGSALAQKPSISISGWTEQIIGVHNNDNEASVGERAAVDQQTDSEIHFDGETTLDNGIKIQYRIELEGNTSSDQIDEHWMRVSGSFGQVVIGSSDSAAQQMVTGYMGSWSTGVGQNLAFDVADWIETPGGHGAASTMVPSTVSRVSLDTDAEKISYFTPRFAGFQLGASYIPHGSLTGTGTQGDDVNNSSATRNTLQHEGFDVAANYVGKWDNIGIGIAVGYGTAEQPGAATNGQGNGKPDDATVWGFGARVDFGGFRVGVGYMDRRDTHLTTSSLTSNSQTTWDFGARYSFGPNAISITYQTSEGEGAVAIPGEDKIKQGMISFRRTLGPGVNWTLNGMWADYTGEVAGSADDNDGFAVTTSILINF